MSVDDVRDRLDINLPEGEYVTLGGFLFDGFGHIPEEGESLDVDGWELRVTEMDKRRIAKVVAKRPIRTVTVGAVTGRRAREASAPPSGSISQVQDRVIDSVPIDGLWRSLVSALRSGRRGPRFKSGQPDSESLQVNS